MRVLITGANGAIGAACVERFLAGGHEVIAQDLDTNRWSFQPGVTTASGNLLSATTLDALSRLAERGLDAVVAAHGVPGGSALSEATDEFIQHVLRINWSTIPLLFGAVSAALSRSDGSFVVVASQAALAGEADNSVYCASKFAVVGWVSALAEQLDGPTAHALCPGATNSALLRASQERFAAAEGVSPEEYYRRRAEQVSLGRYGEPAEIAEAALYLSTPGPRPTILAVTGGDVLL